MNYQPPQTTGAEVLNYTGNAALGGGYDSTGIPAGSGANALAPVNEMLKQLNQQNFVWNTMQYKQAISDRDKSYELLNDPAVNLDHDIMDKDRPALEDQRQKLIESWKKNPNMMANPQAYVEFQKEVGKFKEMATSSKSRNLEYLRQMNAIAADPNINNRKSRIDHLDGQVKKGPLGQIDPYFSNPGFDDKEYFVDVPQEKVGQTQFVIGKDGVARAQTVMQTNPAAFHAPWVPEKLMANNGKGLQDIQILHKSFENSPFATDENFLRSVNEKLNQINTDNKINPNDPNYFHPIATKVGDNWTVTKSPADLAAGLYAYKAFKRTNQEDLSKDYQTQLLNFKKTSAEIGKEYYQGQLYKAQTAGEYAKAGYMKNYYEALGRKADADGNEKKSEMSAPVADAINAFVSASKENSIPVGSLGIGPRLAIMRDFGPSVDWKIAILPMDQRYIKMLSEPDINDKGQTTGTKKPANIYYLTPPNGDITQGKMVGYDKNHNLIRSVDLPNGVDEIVKYNENFDQSDKTIEKINTARQVYQEQLNYSNSKKSSPAPGKTIPKSASWRISGNGKDVEVEVSKGVYKKVVTTTDNGDYVVE